MNNGEINQINIANNGYSVQGNNSTVFDEKVVNSETIFPAELNDQDNVIAKQYLSNLQDNEDALNILTPFVARLCKEGFSEETVSSVLSNINYCDDTIEDRLQTILNMPYEDLQRIIEVASGEKTLQYPQLYDEYNYLIHGQRQDLAYDGLCFDIGGQKVRINIDNNFVSQSYANAFPENNCKVLNQAVIDRIRSLMTNAKEQGLEIPDTFYITDFFGYDERLKDKAYAYSIGESGIMLNAAAVEDNDYFINTIYHETAHYNDSLQGWVSQQCDVKIGEYLDNENGEKYLQKYCVTLANGNTIYPDDISLCVSDYASTDNLEFVAETTSAVLRGDIVKNPDGTYRFGNNKEELNQTQSEKLNDIMSLYNYITQGKIL